jgi:hypothetical protein
MRGCRSLGEPLRLIKQNSGAFAAELLPIHTPKLEGPAPAPKRSHILLRCGPRLCIEDLLAVFGS